MTTKFAIGAQEWPGISKLIEEAGEVQQVCGKLLATYGETKHWDKSDLKECGTSSNPWVWALTFRRLP